jgi:hypothetical protein
VSEWLKEPVSKTGVPLTWDRGFESHPLREVQVNFENKKMTDGRWVLRRHEEFLRKGASASPKGSFGLAENPTLSAKC